MGYNNVGKTKFISYRDGILKPQLYYVNIVKTKTILKSNQNLIKNLTLLFEGNNENIDEKYIKAVKTSIKACTGFLEKYSPNLINKFKSSYFIVDIGQLEKDGEKYFSGLSMTLSIVIGILSSFLNVPLKQSIASTGDLSTKDSLPLKGVLYIPKKAEALLDTIFSRMISVLIVPEIRNSTNECRIKDQRDIFVSSSKLYSNKKSVVYCYNLPQSFKYLTSFVNFVRLMKSIEKKDDFLKEVFPDGFSENEIDSIIGYKRRIALDILFKRIFKFLYQKKEIFFPVILVVFICFFSIGYWLFNNYNFDFNFRVKTQNEKNLPAAVTERKKLIEDKYSIHIRSAKYIENFFEMHTNLRLRFDTNKIASEKHDKMPANLCLFYVISSDNYRSIIYYCPMHFNWDDSTHYYNPDGSINIIKDSVLKDNIIYPFDDRAEYYIQILAIFDMENELNKFFKLYNNFDGAIVAMGLYDERFNEIPQIISNAVKMKN